MNFSYSIVLKTFCYFGLIFGLNSNHYCILGIGMFRQKEFHKRVFCPNFLFIAANFLYSFTLFTTFFYLFVDLLVQDLRIARAESSAGLLHILVRLFCYWSVDYLFLTTMLYSIIHIFLGERSIANLLYKLVNASANTRLSLFVWVWMCFNITLYIIEVSFNTYENYKYVSCTDEELCLFPKITVFGMRSKNFTFIFYLWVILRSSLEFYYLSCVILFGGVIELIFHEFCIDVLQNIANTTTTIQNSKYNKLLHFKNSNTEWEYLGKLNNKWLFINGLFEHINFSFGFYLFLYFPNGIFIITMLISTIFINTFVDGVDETLILKVTPALIYVGKMLIFIEAGEHFKNKVKQCKAELQQNAFTMNCHSQRDGNEQVKLLQEFARIILDTELKLSAAGFFLVSREMVSKIFATALTYLIVMFQLYYSTAEAGTIGDHSNCTC